MIRVIRIGIAGASGLISQTFRRALKAWDRWRNPGRYWMYALGEGVSKYTLEQKNVIDTYANVEWKQVDGVYMIVGHDV